MCPLRPGGAQASTGVPTGAGTAREGLGGGAALGLPGLMWPEEALAEVGFRARTTQTKEALGRPQAQDPWPEMILVGGNSGPGGGRAQAQDQHSQKRSWQ